MHTHQACKVNALVCRCALEANPPNPLVSATEFANDSNSIPVTPVPTPSSILIFGDDFNQGLKPEWQLSAGDWLVVDEKLSAVRFQFIDTQNAAQIMVGETDWTNYDIDFFVGDLIDYFGRNAIIVRVRYQDKDNHPYFIIYRRQAICGVRRNGQTSQLPPIDIDKTTARIRIKTSDNKYELYIDNTRICSFRDNTFSSGRIALEAIPLNNKSAWVDNFAVTRPQ